MFHFHRIPANQSYTALWFGAEQQRICISSIIHYELEYFVCLPWNWLHYNVAIASLHKSNKFVSPIPENLLEWISGYRLAILIASKPPLSLSPGSCLPPPSSFFNFSKCCAWLHSCRANIRDWLCTRMRAVVNVLLLNACTADSDEANILHILPDLRCLWRLQGIAFCACDWFCCEPCKLSIILHFRFAICAHDSIHSMPCAREFAELSVRCLL